MSYVVLNNIKNASRMFLVFLLMSSFQVQAQILEVSINADSMLIGDIFTLEMSIENRENTKVFFPEYKDTIGNKYFEIVETYPEDTFENRLVKKWDLSIYYPGHFQMAGFSALAQNLNSSIDTLQSRNTISIFVKTIEVDTSKAFKPIKPLKNIPFPFKAFTKKYAPYAIGLIAILILLYFLWKLYKNKDKPVYIKPKTALDYHQEAIAKLKSLEQEKLWQEGKTKEYYLGISEILRTYLEGRFEMNAMESTTDEILEDFVALKEYKSLSKRLKEVLQQCDLAKFAKFLPIEDENKQMMKIAQNFVTHTKPKELVVEDKISNEKINSNG